MAPQQFHTLNFFVCGITSPSITSAGTRSLLSQSDISHKNNSLPKICTIPIISKRPCIIKSFLKRVTSNRRPHLQNRSRDFNRAIINESRDQDQAHGRILVLDASFVPKSGKKTYGLDHFWNGCQSRREKGLEILGVALVDVDKNTGFTLSVAQPG